MIWYSEKNDNDIMVSTRIRIARNLKKYPFPGMMSEKNAQDVCGDVKKAIFESNSALAGSFEYLEMAKTNPVNIRALTEQHFISPDLAGSRYGSVLINKDRTMSIMVNEEDHIRLQVILSGMRLKEAWETANRVDDLIEENVEYAFDEELGYLTACPTNLGTGLRASVMMHLPALTMTREISKIIASAGNLGIAIRGMYGEGSEALGNLYQISNQITMGSTEEELITKVENIAKQIEGYEREARKNLLENNKTALENRVWRSYGILKYSREISSKESKSLISDVILGKALNIIDEAVNGPLIELMVKTEPAVITDGREMNAGERDIKRAELIRTALQ
jgi:protein arginine kinase